MTYRELPPPSSSTEVHQQLVQSLSRGDGSVDVFTQDVFWIAEFANAGWALPWFVDSGMLYYRKDLLDGAGIQVPTTWDQLTSAATTLMSSGKAKFGFLWQGKQAEVLVCDLVEFVGSAGGSILGSDGKAVAINDGAGTKGVQYMYDTMNSLKISPKDLLSWDGEPSRRPFTAGQAAFLRNWSYVYTIAQGPSQSQVVDKVRGVLGVIASWNEFMLALSFTSSAQYQTIPVGIANFTGLYFVPWGDIAAASVVVTVPRVVLVLIFQRRIVSGLTAGAVKE